MRVENLYPHLLLVALSYRAVAVVRNALVLGGNPAYLTCDINGTEHLPFSWKDTVYNVGSEPSTIYNSSVGKIEKAYEERGFTITGRSLKVLDKINDVSGSYFCEIYEANGTVLTISYSVGIVSDPKCSKDQEVMEGEQIMLSCSYKSFLSSKPYWTDGIETIKHPEHINEFDLNDFNAIFDASWKHDQSTFKCMLEDAEICSLKIRVKYMTRDLALPEGTKNIHPGDNITCQAKGNPIPHVKLVLLGIEQPKALGSGQVSLPVGENLIGKEVRVRCEAWNEVGGALKNISRESQLFIVEKPVKAGVEEDGDRNVLFIIIGVVIAALILIIAIAIAILVCSKKKDKKEQEKKKDDALLKTAQKKDYNSEMI